MSCNQSADTSAHLTVTIQRVRVQDPVRQPHRHRDERLEEWAERERDRQYRHRPVNDLQRMLFHLLDPKPGEEAKWRRFALHKLTEYLDKPDLWDKAVSVVYQDQASFLNTQDAAYWTMHIGKAVRSGNVDRYCQLSGIDRSSLYRAWRQLRSLGAEVPPCNILPRKSAGTYQLNAEFEDESHLHIIVTLSRDADWLGSDRGRTDDEQLARHIARQLLRLLAPIRGQAREERLQAVDKLWAIYEHVDAWKTAVKVLYQDEVGILDAQDVPYWIRHINAAVATQNINHYCRQRGISRKTLYRWWDSLLVLGADVPHKNLPQE